MSDWFKLTDELGPEKIVYLHDPETEMKAVIVVDTMFAGGAGGGTRMLPDITTAELAGLARAMTYKFAMIDLPIGGAKSGIWGLPDMSPDRREAMIRSFGRLAKPMIESGVAVASDMGTAMEDVKLMYESAGVEHPNTGLSSQIKDGEPLENHATGYGVFVAAKAGCQAAGLELKGARVAIEGFGKAAGGVARYMIEAGANVVAMSNINGTRYSENGLNITSLLAERRQKGDQALTEYESAESLSCQKLFTLPVDIVVPGTRPFMIHGKNASAIQAKVIASIANNPVTYEAERQLFERGVRVIPDFLCNVGGVVMALVDMLGGSEDDLFKALNHMITELGLDIITRADSAGIPPRFLAEKEIKQKLIDQRTGKTEALSFDALLKTIQVRLNIGQKT